MTFDLEVARATIQHYMIENPKNEDDCGLSDLVRQATLAEEALDEIEKLITRNNELEYEIENNYKDDIFNHLINLLVEERAKNIDPTNTQWDKLPEEDRPNRLFPATIIKGKSSLRDLARQQLIEEGKIGNSNHIVGPDRMVPCWHITEEREVHGGPVMKEILESLRSDLTVRELVESFRKKTSGMVPGNWKVVGVQVYLVEESEDILATPGFYSKGFKKENYVHDGDEE